MKIIVLKYLIPEPAIFVQPAIKNIKGRMNNETLKLFCLNLHLLCSAKWHV